MSFCSEFPPGSKDVVENSIRPFSTLLKRFFLQMVLEYTQFEFMQQNNWILPFCTDISPGFLRVPFLHCKTYSLKYWTRLLYIGKSVSQSVCQCVSPSVRQIASPSVSQSASPSLRQSASPSVRPSEFSILFPAVPGSGLVLLCLLF